MSIVISYYTCLLLNSLLPFESLKLSNVCCFFFVFFKKQIAWQFVRKPIYCNTCCILLKYVVISYCIFVVLPKPICVDLLHSRIFMDSYKCVPHPFTMSRCALTVESLAMDWLTAQKLMRKWVEGSAFAVVLQSMRSSGVELK